jgi:hypothetical protein
LEKREEQYKTVIQNLRQQVRKQTPSVSIELYKAAVVGNKITEAELKKATTKISDLECKVNHLEKENLEARLTSNNAKTPNQKVGFDRGGILSPTDFLERGLLGEVAMQDSPVKHWDSNLVNIEQRRSAIPRSSFSQTLGYMQEPTTKTEKRPESPLEKKPMLLKAISRSEGIATENKRRVGLPLASIKAAAPTDTRTEERVHGESTEDLNLTVQRAEQSLMGMTISFRKDPLVCSPLSKTDNDRSKPIEEDDVLTWVDKYKTYQRNVEGQCAVEMPQPGSKARNAGTKREMRKMKAQDPRKAGSGDSQNVQVYVESGILDSRLNSNRQGTSRKIDRDSVSSRNGQTHPRTKTTLKGSGRVLSSVSPKTKLPKENRKSSSMKGTSKVSTRIVKVREMGGRKGLQDKLKQMRSPPGKYRPFTGRSIVVN